jgi:hypothetical protein
MASMPAVSREVEVNVSVVLPDGVADRVEIRDDWPATKFVARLPPAATLPAVSTGPRSDTSPLPVVTVAGRLSTLPPASTTRSPLVRIADPWNVS